MRKNSVGRKEMEQVRDGCSAYRHFHQHLSLTDFASQPTTSSSTPSWDVKLTLGGRVLHWKMYTEQNLNCRLPCTNYVMKDEVS